MNSNRFIFLILAAFIAGTFVLIYIQFNSSANIERLMMGNEQLLEELKISNCLRETERDMIWVESRIRGAIVTNDPSHLEGVDKKIARVRAHLDTLTSINDDETIISYLKQLRRIAREKLAAKHQLLTRFRQTGKMGDISLVVNPRAHETSNQLSTAICRIYDSRHRVVKAWSHSTEKSGQNARLWGGILIAVVVVSASSWFWFIVHRIRWQHQLILQLDESEKKAREAAHIKEKFMANMSHEIRTPLNAILGFTHLLKNRRLDPGSEEFVEAIQKASENLLAIVNDILDLAKIEAGMMRIEASPFSVRDVLRSVTTLFSEKFQEKGLVLRENIEQEVPDTLIGDSVRLTQILVNLIGNAVKFTDRGYIMLHVYTKNTHGEHIRLGFSIRDTGIGIEEEKLASIFERFRQAEDSTTRNYGGTGLGLSIVKELVQLQGGEIEVESQPGWGTTFRFFIPFTLATAPLSAPAALQKPDADDPTTAGVQILIAEDNALNQSLLKHLLNGWNIGYDIAGNGVEALEYLQSKTYDLVLMDIQMPQMDGYSTSLHIRNRLKLPVPIVAMTAHTMPGEREKCLSYGMNEYIAKPIQERSLHQLIDRFVCLPKTLPTVPARSDTNLPFHCINLQYLQEISRGDKAYEKDMTRQFLEIIPEEMQELESAFEKWDFTALHRVAHRMKTSISIMGLTDQLEASLEVLEEASEGNRNVYESMARVKKVCTLALQEASYLFASL